MINDNLKAKEAELMQQLEAVRQQISLYNEWHIEDIDVCEVSGSGNRLSFRERLEIVKLRKRGKKYHEIAKIVNRSEETIKTILSRDAFYGMVKGQDYVPTELIVNPSILKKVPTIPAHIRAINLYYSKKSDGSFYSYKEIYRILLRENYDFGYSIGQMKALIGKYYNPGGRDALTTNPFVTTIDEEQVLASFPTVEQMFMRLLGKKTAENSKQS